MKNYILGYGSLIEKESRLRTTPSAELAFPVIVSGFKRGWFARTGVSGLSTTFLGCIRDEHSHMNGIIYEVSEYDLHLTDLREKGYKRVRIDIENILDTTGTLRKRSNVWIYTNVFDYNKIPDSVLPNKNFPIVQSYVDICINGCFELEAKFPIAKEKMFAQSFIQNNPLLEQILGK